MTAACSGFDFRLLEVPTGRCLNEPTAIQQRAVKEPATSRRPAVPDAGFTFQPRVILQRDHGRVAEMFDLDRDQRLKDFSHRRTLLRVFADHLAHQPIQRRGTQRLLDH